MTHKLWFAYTTEHYEATIAFYRDGLGLPVLQTWDRGDHDRGMIFEVGAGRLELSARPTPDVFRLVSIDPPQGVTMGIEVDDIDSWYQRVLAHQLPVRTPLQDLPWDERGFTISDPNGIVIYIFKVT